MNASQKIIIVLITLLNFGECVIGAKAPPPQVVFQPRIVDHRPELEIIRRLNIPRWDLADAIYWMQDALNITIEVPGIRPAEDWRGLLAVFRERLHPNRQLWIAIQIGSIPMIEMALDHRSQIDARFNRERYTVLHIAAAYGQTELLHYFYDNYDFFETDERAGTQATPLHTAVTHGQTDAVRFLLERGADANARDNQRRTPLHIAADGNSPEIARLLIHHGGALSAEDMSRRTPRDHALQNTGVNDAFRDLFISPLMAPESEREALNNWLFGNATTSPQ